MAEAVADVIVDDRVGLAWAWPEDAADLLEVEAEAVGRAEEHGTGDRWNVGAFRDDVAGGEDLEDTSAEISNEPSTLTAVHRAIEASSCDALIAACLGDGIGVVDGTAESDGGAVVNGGDGALVVGDGITHGLALAEDDVGLVTAFGGVEPLD